MKAGFRQSMAWLHTWSGLLLGWFLFFIFLTGTVGYFSIEIDRWMRPELPRFQPNLTVTEQVDRAVAYLKINAPPEPRLWLVDLPGTRDQFALRIGWLRDGERPVNRFIDGETGQLLASRATGGGQLLYRMHYQLHYLSLNTAYWLVGIASMFMIIGIVTGVIVHRKIFSDFFTFRRSRGQRSWLDAHNVLAVMALPFQVMITYSGLMFFASMYMGPIVTATYGLGDASERRFFSELTARDEALPRTGNFAQGAPIASLIAKAEARWGSGNIGRVIIYNPEDANATVWIRQSPVGPSRSFESLAFNGVTGDVTRHVPATWSFAKTTRDTLLGLHEGLFAGPLLRWLYFFAGLLGTAMIGVGLILWTVKRKERLKDSDPVPFGLVLVERLNISTLVGLPIAIAAYFWANRLIPVSFADRAAWEAHTMFIVWAVLLLHPLARSTRRAWSEQLWIAAAAYALLPILNVLTTNRHLGVSIVRSDWSLAGFDLAMLFTGLAFAAVAISRTRNVEQERLRTKAIIRRSGAGKQPQPAE